jgi:hypothetical protein
MIRITSIMKKGKMSGLHINTELRFDEFLKVVGQLNPYELDQLMSQVISLQAKRRSPNLSKKETELMLTINNGLSPETQKRFNELNRKRQAETLTTFEHKELLNMIERIEKSDAERVGHMAELSRIRGITLSDLNYAKLPSTVYMMI